MVGGAGAGNPPQADVTVSFKANSAVPAEKAGTVGLAGNATAGLFKTAGIFRKNPDGTFTVQDSLGAMITLSAIEVKVQEIDIGLPSGITCAGVVGLYCKGGDAAVRGPYAMNLMSGAATPSINFIKLPEGIYSSIGLDFLQPAFGPDSALIPGSSRYNMAIRGRVAAPDSASSSFELKLDLSDGLDFQDTAGFRIESTALNNLLLKLDVDGWFAGTDFSSCLNQAKAIADSAGTIVLEGDGSCDGLGLRIRKNIEASSEVENEEHIGGL